MLSQQHTSRHDARQHRARPKRHEHYMRCPAWSGGPGRPPTLLLPREFIQILALAQDPVRNVRLARGGVVLEPDVVPKEE